LPQRCYVDEVSIALKCNIKIIEVKTPSLYIPAWLYNHGGGGGGRSAMRIEIDKIKKKKFSLVIMSKK
jgi:hypothetical protein